MKLFNKFNHYLAPGILVISLIVVYSMTLAPGLTWANDGSDGGDLITAAATGGVAHPTGYPVYLLLARLFQLLPIGSLAFRTNLMSVVFTIIATVFVYELVARSLSTSEGTRNWLAGLVSAYAFGLSPLVWSQAVITEVYALHTLFVALILYLSSIGLPPHFETRQVDRLLGLTFGLGMGNHVTTILLLPILLPSDFFRKEKAGAYSFLRRLAWLGIGLLVYLTLPLRALYLPPVNWGNPATLNGFIWLVSGEFYQGQFFSLTLPSIWSQVRASAALLIEQFGLPGLILGLVGLIVFYKPSRLYGNTIWVAFASFAFAILYATRDSFLYLIPVFLCFAIWIGLGLGELLNLLTWRSRQIAIAGSFVFIIYLFVLAGNHWHQVDASRDLRAELFGKEVLVRAPENAIVFAKGDKAIFTMWYFHYALHNRPDLAVVVVDLLPFDWYQQTLRHTYPDLKVPGPFFSAIAVTNPERPVCLVEYAQAAKIQCSSIDEGTLDFFGQSTP